MLDSTTTVPFFASDLYTDYPDFEQQNNFVSEAAQAIMNDVLGNANASTASPLLKAIRDTSASGHFKLWMARPDEQEALIATGLINDKASGELSADSQVPEAGIYLSELQQGKQDSYMKTSTTVTKPAATPQPARTPCILACWIAASRQPCVTRIWVSYGRSAR